MTLPVRMSTSVAVIGAGVMGAPMARRLNATGFDLVVCDRSEGTLRAFADAGVAVTADARACARADVVLVLVTTGEQVRQVVLAENGLLAGLGNGRKPIVAIMSTVSRAVVLELQTAVGDTLRLLDAPISGGATRAADGTLTLMLAGDRGIIDEAAPVWDALATRRFYCGALGAGQVVKLVNNILCDANAIATAEAYRLAVELGLNLDDTTPIFDASSGRNFLSEHPGEATASYAEWSRTRGTFDAMLTIFRKDLHLALDLAGESPASFPVLERLVSTVDALGDETYETWRTVGRAKRPSR